jgi:murein DD-endopeptidase MepM/ murein hydrolase activator NlpD
MHLAGYADTDLDFSEFFTTHHAIAVRFMLQYPKAYAGPLLSADSSNTYFIGQGDYGPSKQVHLVVRMGGGPLSGEMTIPAPLAAGTWHHLAVVRTGAPDVDPLNPPVVSPPGTFTVYLDGQQAGSMSVPAGTAPVGTLRLGRRYVGPTSDDGGEQFYGLIDDLAVFHEALSPSQVAALAAAHHLTGTEPYLLVGYSFGHTPPGGLPPTMTRPVILSGAARLEEVSADRDDVADAELLPTPWTGRLHLPIAPNETWEVVQGYEGHWNHEGATAFSLDLRPSPAMAGRPFLAAAGGTVASVKQDASPGGPSNFISIRHGDHEFGDYLHLAQGSAGVKTGDQVDRGEPLAATGTTGTTDSHLHLAVTNLGEAAKAGGRFATIPVAFCHYGVIEDSGGAYLVHGGVPGPGQRLVTLPGPLLDTSGVHCLGEGLGRPVAAVSAAVLTHTDRLVTAVRSLSGQLRLDVWDVEPAGCVVRKGGSLSAGAVGAIAACPLSDDRMVTAVRDGAGNLKVIVWDVDDVGHVHRRGDHGAGGVSAIAAARLSPGRFATAVRDTHGGFKIIVWDVAPGGTVTRRGEVSGGAVNGVALTSLSETRLFSAARSAGGSLEVVFWDVDGTGHVSLHAGVATEPADAVAVGGYGPTTGVIYARDGSGALRVSAWSLADPTVVLGAQYVADGIGPEFAAFGAGVLAARDPAGKLRVSRWEIRPGLGYLPGTIVESGHGGHQRDVADVENVLRLSTTPGPPGFEIDRIATVCRAADGRLWIAVWGLAVSTIH